MKEAHALKYIFEGASQTMVESALALIQTDAMVYSFQVNRRGERA
jgi:hypothetical protein